jgi:hypothetical protein
MEETANSTDHPSFLLMEGGPLFHLEERMGLARRSAPLILRRAILAALVTWLPLLVLSFLQGTAFGNEVPVSFCRDFSAYTRFLLAVPLLLLAETVIGPRIAEAAGHFITSGVVERSDFRQFDEAVVRGLRLRDSVLAEIIIAILAYIVSITSFIATAVHVSTWYSVRSGGGASLTWAGYWLLGVCMPLFHFLVLRWIWRLFLWFQFLGSIRRLNMQLFSTHPDKAGGLGFVGETQRFFGMLLFAYSIGITGVLANQIVYDKLPLKHFAPAIAAYAVAAVSIMVGPLIVFTGALLETKRHGLHQYGSLATAYTGAFQKKWIQGDNPNGEPLLGTGDIQSLADLGNSYTFVERMNAVPIDPRTLIHLAIASLLPMTPLLLTVMPLKDILKLLFKVLM